MDGQSNKFWEITVSGSDVTVRYGRIGSAGQSKTKSLDDAVAAAGHAEKLIAAKKAKRYAETAAP